MKIKHDNIRYTCEWGTFLNKVCHNFADFKGEIRGVGVR